ncbi:MAG: hypothetical protein ABIV47_04485 [Roseiflexaceae bacterium]
MPNWIDEQVQKRRFEDMVRTAQHDHMVNLALTVGLPRMRFYSPLLAQLGRWLEAYGYRLRMRYGAVPEVAIATDSGGTTSRC